ncbi:MAG: dihydroorotate dehydrogenase catalytic subunit [Halanaerobiales bacterium]|nr:dihydroorotate dehydrogenase catalytic subunit [Halanaerobiales bacterium]
MIELDLTTRLASLKLKNPVITASGTCGYGEELKEYLDPDIPGAITVKGLTIKPSVGNPAPRITETPAGILNSIGLENPGLEEFLATKLSVIGKLNVPVLVNISGHSLDDFAFLAEKLAPYPQIAGLEVNVSCPNLAGGGMAFGTDSELVYRVAYRVKENYPGPVIIKLTPNVTDIVEMAEAAVAGGADIISLINTLLAMAIDIDDKRPLLGNTFGGLSGPAIKPVALRMVYQVASRVKIPIIGMGGIMTGRDAIEFILAGASAVAVGTATLIDPGAVARIIEEIKEYMIEKEIKRIKDLIGQAL